MSESAGRQRNATEIARQEMYERKERLLKALQSTDPVFVQSVTEETVKEAVPGGVPSAYYTDDAISLLRHVGVAGVDPALVQRWSDRLEAAWDSQGKRDVERLEHHAGKVAWVGIYHGRELDDGLCALRYLRLLGSPRPDLEERVQTALLQYSDDVLFEEEVQPKLKELNEITRTPPAVSRSVSEIIEDTSSQVDNIQ